MYYSDVIQPLSTMVMWHPGVPSGFFRGAVAKCLKNVQKLSTGY